MRQRVRSAKTRLLGLLLLTRLLAWVSALVRVAAGWNRLLSLERSVVVLFGALVLMVFVGNWKLKIEKSRAGPSECGSLLPPWALRQLAAVGGRKHPVPPN
jgi:hypothetical protein